MSLAKHSIRLEWKEFNLNLTQIDAWLRTNLDPAYCGNSAHAVLELWFTSEPSEDDVAAIELYWENLTEESEEATS